MTIKNSLFPPPLPVLALLLSFLFQVHNSSPEQPKKKKKKKKYPKHQQREKPGIIRFHNDKTTRRMNKKKKSNPSFHFSDACELRLLLFDDQFVCFCSPLSLARSLLPSIYLIHWWFRREAGPSSSVVSHVNVPLVRVLGISSTSLGCLSRSKWEIKSSLKARGNRL